MMKAKLLVALATFSIALVLAWSTLQLVPPPFGIQQAQIEKLRSYLSEGHFLFAPYPPDNRPPENVPEKSTSTFRRNILSMSEHAAGKGCEIVLVTMPFNGKLAASLPGLEYAPIWVPVTREHNQALREIAEEKGYLLVDLEKAVGNIPESYQLFRDRVREAPDSKQGP